MRDFRCQKCNKILGKYRECQELEIKCPRCGLINSLIQQKPQISLVRNAHLTR